VSRTRVLEWFEVFGAGREDLESRNPETVTTVGENVAREGRLAVKLIYRQMVHQAPHEDSENRKICAKFVLHSRTINSFCRDSEALPRESWCGHHPSNSFTPPRPSRHFYNLKQEQRSKEGSEVIDEIIENVLAELNAGPLGALDDCPMQHLERSKKRVAVKGDYLTEKTEIFSFLHVFLFLYTEYRNFIFLTT